MATISRTSASGEALSLSEQLDVEHRRDGEVIGAGHTGGDGRNSSIDLSPEGGVKLRATGVPRRGEEGSEIVTRRLAERLSELGRLNGFDRILDGRDDPGVVEPVDCAAVDVDGNHVLKVQVVRAALSLGLAELGGRGAFDSATSVKNLAEMVAASIHKKETKYAPPAIADVVLALDAMDHHASVAIEPVVDALREARRGSAAKFKAIWLVGPTTVIEIC